MPESLNGAKVSESPTGKDGAKVSESPTVEELQAQLKEAQGAAETYRKSSESLQSDIESAREELTELREGASTAATREREAELTRQLKEDKSALVKKFRAQAEAGDVHAKAWLAAAEAIAEEKFEQFHQKSVKEMTEREMARDFKTRDDMLVSQAAKRSLSVEEFKKLVNPYAKHYPKTTYSPSDQLKLAIELMEKEEGIQAKSKEIETEKAKNANFRDDGTGNDASVGGGKKKDFSKIGAWQEAKTPQEKEQSLYSI